MRPEDTDVSTAAAAVYVGKVRMRVIRRGTSARVVASICSSISSARHFTDTGGTTMHKLLTATLVTLAVILPARGADLEAAQSANYAITIQRFRQLADDGNPAAQNALGTMYAEGLGVARDGTLAAAWYLKATKQNDSAAHKNLGSRYQTGVGGPQDFL
jgi:hypothetical protein